MKILIVDDHPVVRSGLRRLLASEAGFDVCEAASGRGALAAFREHRPHLVVLDLGMPGMGGLEVIERLKIEESDVRILVLSMHQETLYATRALQAGALGFVSKSAPVDQLLEAIKRVAAGHSFIEHAIAQELALANVCTHRHPLQELSTRELEILRLLADGRSLREIADTIGISYKTAANTCSQIKAKLHVAHTADLVRIAIQNGISAQ